MRWRSTSASRTTSAPPSARWTLALMTRPRVRPRKSVRRSVPLTGTTIWRRPRNPQPHRTARPEWAGPPSRAGCPGRCTASGNRLGCGEQGRGRSGRGVLGEEPHDHLREGPHSGAFRTGHEVRGRDPRMRSGRDDRRIRRVEAALVAIALSRVASNRSAWANARPHWVSRRCRSTTT